MSFNYIEKQHPRDPDLPDRAFDIGLRLALLRGDLYTPLRYEFSDAFPNGGEYVYMEDRKPSVPSGTKEIKTQVGRQAAMLFGEAPQIETSNDAVRTFLAALSDDLAFAPVLQNAAIFGSTGSVALHLRYLAADHGQPATLMLEAYLTQYLTPEFDPNNPRKLIKVTEQFKLTGKQVQALGYTVKEEDAKSYFWWKRIWDTNSEIRFVPWLVDAEAEAKSQGKTFAPLVDEAKTVTHNLGRCLWRWIKAPGSLDSPAEQAVDGPCIFEPCLEHAYQLDYQESQIIAGIKYNMSPTMVLHVAPEDDDGSQPTSVPRAEGQMLTLAAESGAKAYYVELQGSMFTEARAKAAELRKSIIEYMNGDRCDPTEMKQDRQGSKVMAMIQKPLLDQVKLLRKTYELAILDIVEMILAITQTRTVLVKGQTYSKLPKVTDLKLRWGIFYEETSEELRSEAMANDLNIKNGLVSRLTITNKLVEKYGIIDVPTELIQVNKEQEQADERAIKLAGAQAQVQVKDNLP